MSKEPEPAPTPNIFAVMLKADNGGTATVLCKSVAQDPMFPEKVVLVGIVGLSWPVAERWIHVDQWSINKSSVLNWMNGPARMTPELDFEALVNRERTIPVIEGTRPNELLLSHPEELEGVVEKEPAKTPPKKPTKK